MNKRSTLFSSIIAMVFSVLYLRTSTIVMINLIEKKFPNGLFKIDKLHFWNDNSVNYLEELTKMQLLAFIIFVSLISITLTFLFWKRGKDFRSVGLYFFTISVFTILNALFSSGFFKIYNLFLFILFAVPFAIGIIKKKEKLTFISGLFVSCSIALNIYDYFIGFQIDLK